jgi:putative phage-type endonuclease
MSALPALREAARGMSADERASRRLGLGASEIAVIMGVDPYRTTLDLWLEKRGEMPPQDDSEAALMGRLLEPVVAQRYLMHMDEQGDPVTLVAGEKTWHPDGLLYATPDFGVAPANGGLGWLLECKTKNWRTAQPFGEPGTDQVPPEILCQVIAQQGCTGITGRVDVGVLVDGRQFRVYRVGWDAELWASMVEVATHWWQRHIIDGVEPHVGGSSAKQYMARRFAHAADTIAESSDYTEGLLWQIAEAKRLAKLAELAEDDASAKLMQYMGEHKTLKGEVGSVSWHATKGRAAVDYRGIVEEIGVPAEVIQRHTRIGNASRTFRFTPARKPEVTLLDAYAVLPARLPVAALTSGEGTA